MGTYSFYPTLLNDFRNYQLEKTWGNSGFILCTEEKLLDKLNKKPYEQSEAMLKGIAFEQLVALESGTVHNGFEFEESVVEEVRDLCKKGVWQKFVQFSISVDGHRVRLYGYLDLIKMWRTIDIKTGSQYEFPAYDDYFQHHVYLFGCRNENIQVTEHLYVITDFKQVYLEPYDFLPDKMMRDLQLVCKDLIDFIELRKEVIHNPKLWQ